MRSVAVNRHPYILIQLTPCTVAYRNQEPLIQHMYMANIKTAATHHPCAHHVRVLSTSCTTTTARARSQLAIHSLEIFHKQM